MNSKKEIKKELEAIAPFLASLKEQEKSRKVPPNYFEQLEMQIMEQVSLESKPTFEPPATSMWQQFWERVSFPRLAFGLASLIVLVVMSVTYLNEKILSEDTFATISEVEALDYIANHIDDFETNHLLEDLDISSLETVLNDDELDEYLDDILLDVDLETLEELL